MENEIWKDIEGFENYQISNLGNVRALNKYNRQGLSKELVKQSKIIKPIINTHGYCSVNLYKDKKCYRKDNHRLVAKMFIPIPKRLLQVNHIDGNKQNNNIDNLEWVSAKENTQHAIKIGLIKK